MILEDRLTDSDRVEIEKIFSVENLISKKVGLTKTRSLRKRIYIVLLILSILSILVYCLGYYILFRLCIIEIFLSLILYIVYMFLRRKSEKILNKMIWQKPTYSKREIVNDEILGDGKCLFKLSEVNHVIKYYDMFFLIIVDNTVRVLKIGEEQAPIFIGILNRKHISFEEKDGLFNIYKCLKQKYSLKL